MKRNRSYILTREITLRRKATLYSCHAVLFSTPFHYICPFLWMMSSKGAPQNNGSSVPPLLIVSNIGKAPSSEQKYPPFRYFFLSLSHSYSLRFSMFISLKSISFSISLSPLSLSLSLPLSLFFIRNSFLETTVRDECHWLSPNFEILK